MQQLAVVLSLCHEIIALDKHDGQEDCAVVCYH